MECWYFSLDSPINTKYKYRVVYDVIYQIEKNLPNLTSTLPICICYVIHYHVFLYYIDLKIDFKLFTYCSRTVIIE